MKMLFQIFTLALPKCFIKCLRIMLRPVVFSGKPAAASCTRCTHFKQTNAREYWLSSLCGFTETATQRKLRCLCSLRDLKQSMFRSVKQERSNKMCKAQMMCLRKIVCIFHQAQINCSCFNKSKGHPRDNGAVQHKWHRTGSLHLKACCSQDLL